MRRRATFQVPFEAGTLKAVAKNNGMVVATHELRTAGKPAKIVLTADRKSLPANWDEVATVRTTVVDENGTPVPTASDTITFEATGPAKIVAVDSPIRPAMNCFKPTNGTLFKGSASPSCVPLRTRDRSP